MSILSYHSSSRNDSKYRKISYDMLTNLDNDCTEYYAIIIMYYTSFQHPHTAPLRTVHQGNTAPLLTGLMRALSTSLEPRTVPLVTIVRDLTRQTTWCLVKRVLTILGREVIRWEWVWRVLMFYRCFQNTKITGKSISLPLYMSHTMISIIPSCQIKSKH